MQEQLRVYTCLLLCDLFNVIIIVVIIFIVLIGLWHTTTDEIYCKVTEQRLVSYIYTDKFFTSCYTYA